MSWRVRLPLLALFGAAAVFAHRMADGYIDRLADHSGYFLVGVDDAVGAPYARPRHTVIILVDGLTKSAAESFASKQRLAAAGQCRTMEVGPMTVSRPIYAVYSTGLVRHAGSATYTVAP